ncbi:MAG: hypothetical protein E6H64_01920 [Betaproteobacteria bacterium]|jgi:hypothetical protein|nr:MAG: hypothetical protein E6H64_01920 [Betaproteobacteria bacterium]
MSTAGSLLDELRTQYEAARQSTHEHADVEGFQEFDARLRKAFRWLEKAITYLDGLKPAIEHRFDLGHGLVFDSPRFGRGSVGQHTRRIVGFPVLDEINIYYEIVAAKALTIEVAPGGVALADKVLDDAGLQYTSRRVEDAGGTVRKCLISVPPAIPANVLFRADYQTGLVTVTLVNVDRFDRVSLEFPSTSIDEPVLEDLVRLILGRDAAFLRRAPLAGIHGQVPART